MKTAISIPDDLFAAAEAASRRLGLSRSQLFRKAIAAYLEAHGTEGVTEKLNEIYTDDVVTLDPVLERLQFSVLDRESW
jgi:metal-responsive CopG/Arc/MetJ family transcriptional regulator